MSFAENIAGKVFARDIMSTAVEPRQAGAWAITDPLVGADIAFRNAHGMSRADYAERARQWNQDDREARAVADLDVENMPGTTVRDQWAAYSGTLAAERIKLDAAVAKKEQLIDIVAAPAARETKVQAALRHTADFFLGRSAEDSDAEKRDALYAQLAADRHRAEAAKLAMVEVERDIETARTRVRYLVEREMDYLGPVVHELAEPLRQEIAKRRADLAVLEKIAEPLKEFSVFANLPETKAVSSIKWRNSWKEIADALRADPRADVSKMLPKF